MSVHFNKKFRESVTVCVGVFVSCVIQSGVHAAQNRPFVIFRPGDFFDPFTEGPPQDHQFGASVQPRPYIGDANIFYNPSANQHQPPLENYPRIIAQTSGSAEQINEQIRYPTKLSTHNVPSSRIKPNVQNHQLKPVVEKTEPEEMLAPIPRSRVPRLLVRNKGRVKNVVEGTGEPEIEQIEPQKLVRTSRRNNFPRIVGQRSGSAEIVDSQIRHPNTHNNPESPALIINSNFQNYPIKPVIDQIGPEKPLRTSRRNGFPRTIAETSGSAEQVDDQIRHPNTPNNPEYAPLIVTSNFQKYPIAPVIDLTVPKEPVRTRSRNGFSRTIAQPSRNTHNFGEPIIQPNQPNVRQLNSLTDEPIFGYNQLKPSIEPSETSSYNLVPQKRPERPSSRTNLPRRVVHTTETAQIVDEMIYRPDQPNTQHLPSLIIRPNSRSRRPRPATEQTTSVSINLEKNEDSGTPNLIKDIPKAFPLTSENIEEVNEQNRHTDSLLPPKIIEPLQDMTIAEYNPSLSEPSDDKHNKITDQGKPYQMNNVFVRKPYSSRVNSNNKVSRRVPAKIKPSVTENSIKTTTRPPRTYSRRPKVARTQNTQTSNLRLSVAKPEDVVDEPSEQDDQVAVHSSEVDEHPSNHEASKSEGGGHSHEAGHHASHGDKEVDEYESKHHHDEKDTEKHEDHNKKSHHSEKGGHNDEHHDEAGHYKEHDEAQKSHKSAKFGEKKGHKRGHKTKGYHNKFHRDEYHREHRFYDDAHKEGYHEKHGDSHAKYKKKQGGHKNGDSHKSGNSSKKHGKKDVSKKGHLVDKHKGYEKEEGHEKHHNHHRDYHKKQGNNRGQQHGYVTDQ